MFKSQVLFPSYGSRKLILFYVMLFKHILLRYISSGMYMEVETLFLLFLRQELQA